MHHQHRNGDPLQVLGEVGLREGDDAVVVGLGSPHHALAPPVLDDRLVGFDPGPVEAIEGTRGQGAVEHRPVGGQLSLEIVEHALGQPTGVGIGLNHERRDRADEHGFGHAVLAVAGDVVDDLAPAGRVADMDSVVEIEMGRERGQIIGVVIHVVTIAVLRRAAMAPPVVGDDPVAVL